MTHQKTFIAGGSVILAVILISSLTFYFSIGTFQEGYLQIESAPGRQEEKLKKPAFCLSEKEKPRCSILDTFGAYFDLI